MAEGVGVPVGFGSSAPARSDRKALSGRAAKAVGKRYRAPPKLTIKGREFVGLLASDPPPIPPSAFARTAPSIGTSASDPRPWLLYTADAADDVLAV